MTTFAPLPSWAEIAAGLVGEPAPDEELARPWRQNGERAFWFSRSAWALHALARWWEIIHDGRKPSVWLPDYFCNQSTEPLRRTGAELAFYPLTGDLEPDWQTCRQLCAAGQRPDFFVLTHYFGHAADGASAAAFCREAGTLLIEDAAHVLVPEHGIGCHGDFVFYSPHKILAVPDGALLLARPSKKGPDLDLLSRFAAGKKTPNPGTWLLKRAAQKILPGGFLRSRIRRVPGFGYDPPGMTFAYEPSPSRMARRLLYKMVGDLGSVSQKRKNNAAVWRDLLDKSDSSCRPFFHRRVEGSAPYRFVLQCPDSETASSQFEIFRQRGVPVESWPDLPPEVLARPNLHEQAILYRETLLFFPVHGSLEPERARGETHSNPVADKAGACEH